MQFEAEFRHSDTLGWLGHTITVGFIYILERKVESEKVWLLGKGMIRFFQICFQGDLMVQVPKEDQFDQFRNREGLKVFFLLNVVCQWVLLRYW